MYQIPKDKFHMIMDQLARAKNMTENAMRLLELYKKEEKTDPDAYLKRCCMRTCANLEKAESKNNSSEYYPSVEKMMEREQHFYENIKKYKY